MLVKSWFKLLASILISQSAGFVGTFFTINAIPSWYALLNKPSFSPPNWLFGPVWTILYTLIGISLYLIWTNKRGSLKLFSFHLFLNAIWSPIFFGAKNLGLAFIVIIIMDITLIIIIKNFYKINKTASLILIPYLIWISFASLLNFSIWKLNPQNGVKNVFAQDFNFAKAREDFIFTDDNYRKDLFDFNLKKAAYQQNQTLSLKEELRISLYKFVESRNKLIKNYLTMIRIKILESKGLDDSQKGEIYSRLDPEVVWYEKRLKNYDLANDLEEILKKTKEEDAEYKTNTQLVIYYTLAKHSLNQVRESKSKHIALYNKLKDESASLIKLGRADAKLFDRWYKDIDQELNNINEIENKTETEITKIFGSDEYQRDGSYKKALQTLTPVTYNLSRLNGFVMELENAIANKR